MTTTSSPRDSRPRYSSSWSMGSSSYDDDGDGAALRSATNRSARPNPSGPTSTPQPSFGYCPRACARTSSSRSRPSSSTPGTWSASSEAGARGPHQCLLHPAQPVVHVVHVSTRVVSLELVPDLLVALGDTQPRAQRQP